MHKATNISADTESLQMYPSGRETRVSKEKGEIKPLGQGIDLQIWNKQAQHTGK